MIIRQVLIGLVMGVAAVAAIVLMSKPKTAAEDRVTVRALAIGQEQPAGTPRTRVYDVRWLILEAGRFQQAVRAKVGKEPAVWKQREPDLAQVLIRATYSAMHGEENEEGRVEYFAGQLIVSATEEDHARVEAMLRGLQSTGQAGAKP